MGLVLLGSEAVASGGAGSSAFTSANDKDGRKERDSGLTKGKGSGRAVRSSVNLSYPDCN